MAMNDLQDLLKILQDKKIFLVHKGGSVSEADGGLYQSILNQTQPREAPTGGADMANVEKEYLGSAGADSYFYLAKKTDQAGGIQDLLILDAEDKELASAISLNVDPQNVKEFVKYAVKKLDITMLSFDIVEKYFFTPEQKGEVKHETPDKDRKGPDQTGAEHSDKATGKDVAGAPGGAEEAQPGGAGVGAKESKVNEANIDLDTRSAVKKAAMDIYQKYGDTGMGDILGMIAQNAQGIAVSNLKKEFGDDNIREATSDWKCQECGHHFNKNVPKSGEMKCPKCHSTDIDVNDDVGERKTNEAKFEIGEVVMWRGGKWEIADHHMGTYALWSPDKEHKKEVQGWIPEDQLARTNEAKEEVKCRYCGKPSEDKSGVCDACTKKYESKVNEAGDYQVWMHNSTTGETLEIWGDGDVVLFDKEGLRSGSRKFDTRDSAIACYKEAGWKITESRVKESRGADGKINEGGSGNKVKDFKPGDYGMLSMFSTKELMLVRVLPWPSDEDEISGEDRKAKTGMKSEVDPDAQVQVHFSLPPVKKDRSMYVETVDKYGMGEEPWHGIGTKHFVNPDNVYKNVSQIEKGFSYLYPHVLKKSIEDLRNSPMGKKLGEFGLDEIVTTASADGVKYEPTGQPADVKHAQKVGDKSKMHHKTHDPAPVAEAINLDDEPVEDKEKGVWTVSYLDDKHERITKVFKDYDEAYDFLSALKAGRIKEGEEYYDPVDVDAAVTKAGPAFKDYVLKVHKHPWHQLSDETLKQALEDYAKEGATTEGKIKEAQEELQKPTSKAQEIFKKLIDDEIVAIKKDTEGDDALGMDQYAFHPGEDNKVYVDALLYDVLKGEAEYGFGRSFMTKLDNALHAEGLYLEYDGGGVWTFANEGKQDVADPFIAYKTQGAAKHPVFDDRKGTRHGDDEMVEGENDLKGQAGSGTVAGTPSKTYYTVTSIPGSPNWEVMKMQFGTDKLNKDVLKADLKSKEDAIRYAINAGAKEDDIMVNEAMDTRVEITLAGTIKDLDKRTDLTLVTDSQDVQAVREYFGSVEWQDEQIANIKGKLERGEELSGSDTAFIEIQMEHNKRAEIEELDRMWKASEKKGAAK